MKRKLALTVLIPLALLWCGAENSCSGTPDSIAVEKQRQETLQRESNMTVGMPAVHNFREKKLLKDIIELRDQNGLVTYTYIVAEMTGKLVFLGESVGYGIPYATQFTNPQQTIPYGQGATTIAQADPNGLYSPATAEGTWVLLKDPNGGDVKPVYVEPRVIVSPFRLQTVP
jgi:hypothetical protein